MTFYGFFLSNAIAEANNDNIQTLVDVCYGLNNFERSRNRILYINRNKKWQYKKGESRSILPLVSHIEFQDFMRSVF